MCTGRWLWCVYSLHILNTKDSICPSTIYCNIAMCKPSPMSISHLSTKLLTLVKLCLVSVTEMPWPSRYQLMVGGGLPLATHFREREGPVMILLFIQFPNN